MIERLDRGLPFVSVIEQSCRIRFVESNSKLMIPDNSMHKRELPGKFDGLDMERLTYLEIAGLGFIPQNELEKKMLTFLNNPIIHRYPSGDSPAKYFMEIVADKHAILASYLPPNSMTSDHKHSPEYNILEEYFIIGGKPILKLEKDFFGLERGARIQVPLDTHHQLVTGEEPAFTLIIMKNAGLVERKNWHR